MVFFLILIGLMTVITVILAIVDEDAWIILLVGTIIIAFCFLMITITSKATKGRITDIRENPTCYSIFDKHDANKRMRELKNLQGTIFSFYNGFDLTYIEEN